MHDDLPVMRPLTDEEMRGEGCDDSALSLAILITSPIPEIARYEFQLGPAVHDPKAD